MGCGSSRTHMGDSSQAVAHQQHFSCTSTIASRKASSRCREGALETTVCAFNGRCSAVDMGSHCGARCALFLMQQGNCLGPRRLHGGSQIWIFLSATSAETFLPAVETSMSAAGNAAAHIEQTQASTSNIQKGLALRGSVEIQCPFPSCRNLFATVSLSVSLSRLACLFALHFDINSLVLRRSN